MLSLYVFLIFFWNILKSVNFRGDQTFPDLVEKEQLNLTSTGLIINGTVWVKNLYLSQISHKQSNFESLRQYYFGKTYIFWGVQIVSTRRPGWFWTRFNISKYLRNPCNNHQLQLSVYNMCCSYMVLTNPHVKPWIQFIIMKIFMKIVQICPKSPRFTVVHCTNIQRKMFNMYYAIYFVYRYFCDFGLGGQIHNGLISRFGGCFHCYNFHEDWNLRNLRK